MNSFFQHLNAPEYMHVLLNPLPVYGLAMGFIALVGANRHRPRGRKNIIMNTSIRSFAASVCALLLSSCAGNFQAPPLSVTNPANAEAKESVTPVAKPMLGRDAITQKTNERLAANAPVSPSFQPSEMQQMHEGMQHEKTGGTKMDSGEKPMSGRFYYTCVMHPQIHQEKPGKCPICGMTLIKKEEGSK